jgi:uncharacterized protein YbcI
LVSNPAVPRERLGGNRRTMAEEVVNDRSASMLTRVSDEMVQLYKNLFGRGPTRARTHFAGPDTLICTLEDSLTPAERTLVEMGEHTRLRDTRMFFQHAREEDFRELVQAITGRQVRAFVSGIDPKKDVSAEVFYLEPEDR